MRFVPYPKDVNVQSQSLPVPGSQTKDTSAIWKNGTWEASAIENNVETGFANPKTLFELFEQSVARHPTQPLFMSRPRIKPLKQGGVVTFGASLEETTYAQVQQRRTNLGSALLSLERLGRLHDPKATGISPPEIIYPGLPIFGGRLKAGARRGWAVGIWSENREEWQVVDLACQAYGLVSVSLYETLGADAAEFIINHCPVSIVFASAHHMISLLRLAPRCPSLRVIVSMDPVPPAERDVLTQWANSVGLLFLDMAEMEQWGTEPSVYAAAGPLEDEQELDKNRIVTISYTSGTTGNPKGVVLTNWNITSAIISNGLGVTENMPKTSWRFFSYLPLSHIYERFLQVLVMYGDGIICFTSGDNTKLLEDAQIIKPHFFPGVPRVYNRIHAAIKSQMNAPGLKGALLRRAVAVKLENFRERGTVSHKIYDALVFRKVRGLIGGEVEYFGSGAAPLAAEVHELLSVCFCVPIVQGYGMTETVGTCTKGIIGDVKALGTCGQIQPCNELRLADVAEMGYTHKDTPNPRGEICIRGSNIFAGYLHDPDNSSKTISTDGWMHTGDIGEIDSDGRLKIVDRVKNVVKLSQGEYVALEKIEGVYALDPLFLTLLVHADSLRSSLMAIAVLDPTLAAKLVSDVVGQVVSVNDLDALDRAVKDNRIRRKIVTNFAKVAKDNKLNGFEAIKGVYLTVKPFDDDLMTPTFKVKRNVAAKRYKKEIEKVYAEIEGDTEAKL